MSAGIERIERDRGRSMPDQNGAIPDALAPPVVSGSSNLSISVFAFATLVLVTEGVRIRRGGASRTGADWESDMVDERADVEGPSRDAMGFLGRR